MRREIADALSAANREAANINSEETMNMTTSPTLKMGYVSPAFPSLLVFEQNEVLGLLQARADVDLVSCRKSNSNASEFAKQITERALYFRWHKFVSGMAWCLARRPKRLFTIVARCIREVVADRARTKHHVAAVALAATHARLGLHNRWEWIHADFTQGSMTVAWHLATLLDLPFSAMARAGDMYNNSRGARERMSFYRNKLSHARLIFAEHNYAIDELSRQLGNDIRHKAVVQRIGTRPEQFPILPIPDDDDRPQIVALGRLVEKKGFHRLIEAVAELRERGLHLDCAIHGEGPERSRLEKLIREKHVANSVTLPGTYDQNKLSSLLRPARCLVVPSVVDSRGDMDGTPTVIYEAMAHGRPVIGTRLSGIPEVIKPGHTGWLVPPDDTTSLANAIAEVFQHRDRCCDFGSNAREYVVSAHDHRKLGRDFIKRVLQNLRCLPRDKTCDDISKAA